MFLLLDATKIDIYLIEAKQLENQHIALYHDFNNDLIDYGPYIFSYDNLQFNEWHQQEGWGKSWGLIVSADSSLQELSRHLRKFLMVTTEEGKQLYFRFYDPRVLRIFLPTCDVQQLADFFGPIHYFFMEDEDPNFALKFSLENGELQTERIKQNLSVTV